MGSKHQIRTIRPPQLREDTDGVVVEPAQTLDDVQDKVHEVSPTYTILASKCITETIFDSGVTEDIQAFDFALPHLVKTTDTTYQDDVRGQLVELLRSGVSFKNVSNQEVRIHANMPVCKQHYPTEIYTRLSGFRNKVGKKGQLVDDIVLKPGETGTFKVNIKYMANEYLPMQRIDSDRVWINMIAFAVVTRNTNIETGVAYNDDTAIVELRPKMLYTRKKSHPITEQSITTTYQSKENFALTALAAFDDLYTVYPINVKGSSRIPDAQHMNVPMDFEIFGDATECPMAITRQQVREGDLIGYHEVQLHPPEKDRSGKHLKHGGIPKDAPHHAIGLTVAKVGGGSRPLEMSDYQTGGYRLCIPGLNINSGDIHPSYSGPMAGPITSWWKYDRASGYWLLFDEVQQAPVWVADPLDGQEICSTQMPVFIVSGVYNKQEKEEQLNEIMLRGVSEHGLKYGTPNPWGTVVRKSVSVIEVVGKVGGNAGV
jgi:hypothetical protein